MIQSLDLNKNPIQVKRALLSVYDKKNIVELAKALNKNNTEILKIIFKILFTLLLIYNIYNDTYYIFTK